MRHQVKIDGEMMRRPSPSCQMPGEHGGFGALQFTEEFGLRLTRIGRVVAGRPGVTLLREGESIPIPAGFDHFRKK